MKLLIVPAAVLLTGALTMAPSLAKDIDGTDSNDTLKGTAAADTIRGFGDNDRLEGRGGNDTLIGGTGNDTLIGGIGRDQIILGTGGDAADAGKGNDVIRMKRDNWSDPVQCGPGHDTVYVNGRDPGDVFIDCENVVFQ